LNQGADRRSSNSSVQMGLLQAEGTLLHDVDQGISCIIILLSCRSFTFAGTVAKPSAPYLKVQTLHALTIDDCEDHLYVLKINHLIYDYISSYMRATTPCCPTGLRAEARGRFICAREIWIDHILPYLPLCRTTLIGCSIST